MNYCYKPWKTRLPSSFQMKTTPFDVFQNTKQILFWSGNLYQCTFGGSEKNKQFGGS